jgi:hypothetical protein
MRVRQLEWTGALTGIAGSGLLACHLAISGYGFGLFLLSNLFWLAFGVKSRAWGLVTMQVGYTVTSLIGLYRWLA